jgi:tetratricopeptide (TPR) repeat protein
MSAERYDAFVSYGHGDAPWVHTLAENLERLGLRVFLDAWELVAGDLIAVRLQQGLAAAGAVVFVVSAESVGRGWVNEEFAAAVAGAAAGAQRLIPVLAGEVGLPAFVASRLYVDFRHADSPAAYEAKVRELAAAVRGQPGSARPEPGGGIVPPPAAYRAEGPRPARLTIAGDVVTFTTAGQEASHEPVGLDARAAALLTQAALSRAWPGSGPVRAAGTAMAAGMHAALVQAGTALGRCFLDGAAGEALAAEVAAAAAGGAAVQLAVDVQDAGLAALPWEALVLPGQFTPLVLQERVEVYRTVTLEHRPPAIRVRGPLRILAVIASPDTGGGELLDYEAELSAIISAVNPARRGVGAFVEVLNWGSLAAIRAALLARRYHVLHISCHARPGALVLEDAAGNADRVSAEKLAGALPADRGVPLVVLAGCSTALAPAPQTPAPGTGQAGPGGEGSGATAAETAGALAGLARELLGRGVPAVVAMTAPVTDRYATAFAAEAYRQLAAREDPVPLAAISDARRAVEAARRALPAGDPWGAVAEWATAVLVQAGPPLALFHPSDGLEQLAAPAGPVFDPAMVVRRVGEFVGRRAELRDLLAALRGSGAGVVVHGIGGVGKSTLAAQLAEQLGPGRGLVVAVSGAAALNVDLVFEALRTALVGHAVGEGLGDRDPVRQAAAALMDAGPPWRERLELVRQVVLPRLPVLLLVDNAEDLLTGDSSGRELADVDLAGFVAAWVRAGPQAKLVVTSRYPFTLPAGMAKRLRWHHLGPLSLAETRKLIWRLPALDALPPDDQQRAYAMVGGHPRTLEYLDALLRGGQAVFPDVAGRLETAIASRGVADPQQWMAGVEGDLDRALAETITLAADDVLLDDLLASLQDAPPALEILRRLAVYRRPVDDTGAAWQLSPLTSAPGPPAELADRLRPVLEALAQAGQAGTATSVEDLGLDPAAVAQYHADTAESARPPVRLTDEAHRALGLLAGLGLVTPATDPDAGGEPGASGVFVHRWTAAALAARTSAAELTDAHRKAAAYWRWRVAVRPQSRAAAVEQLLEARYHHHAAGDLDDALEANGQACDQLWTWGAWTTEHHLLEEALGWVPPRSRHAANILHRLGLIAEYRGDWRTAEQRYQDSLAIKQEIGDRAGTATSYGQLGTLAARRGDYATAEERHRAALAIFEETGDRAGTAAAYHALGIVAESRGDYGTAEQYYHDSLAISQEIGNRAGTATSYHQLGSLAYSRGDYDTAEERYGAALAILEETGDRANIAIAYHQLGIIAENRGDYGTAEERYHAALAILEEIGDRAGTAASYGQLGTLALLRGDYATAEERYGAALAIFEEIGDRAGTATAYHALGMIAKAHGDHDTAEQYYKDFLAISQEIGNRVGTATSYHQLGTLAYDRGDYDIAEQYYQESLAINQKVGNRADIAVTFSQLGVLRTSQGRPADAVSYQVQALAIRAELSSPAAAADVRMLRQQRAALGDQQFQRILRTLTDNDSAATIMQLTEQAP